MNIERIENSVEVNDNGCWIWIRSCNSSGYGQLTECKRYWLAHRYSFACSNELPRSAVVRHNCHTPRCCNPDHLEIGTHKDNYHDSVEAYMKSSEKRRKTWVVEGVSYDTSRDVVEKTGISMNSVIKYTNDGVFDVEAYTVGCIRANVTPKL